MMTEAANLALTASCEVVDCILNDGTTILYEKYLQPKIKPYSTKWLSSVMNHAVNVGTISRDFGVLTSELEQIWCDEDEPVSSINNNYIFPLGCSKFASLDLSRI